MAAIVALYLNSAVNVASCIVRVGMLLLVSLDVARCQSSEPGSRMPLVFLCVAFYHAYDYIGITHLYTS